MSMLFLISCIAQKTALVGVIDYTYENNCSIVLDNTQGDTVVFINSKVCKNSKEGDILYFYVKNSK